MDYAFRNALGISESGGDYSAVNDLGYTGKYQWGNARLADYNKAMGTDYTLKDLLKSPDLQEKAQAWSEGDIMDYVADNGLDAFYGKTIQGITMTPSAMMGMAHIGGRAGMKKWLLTGGEYNPEDKNSTSIADYAAKFATRLPSGMGQAGISFGEGMPSMDEALAAASAEEPTPETIEGARANYLRQKGLEQAQTAFEMLQDSGGDFCPAGTQYDHVKGECVQIPVMLNSPRPKPRPLPPLPPGTPRPVPRPSNLSVLNTGPRPQPRPANAGITSLING
jgi:hypothetical protein